jgi:H+/Cl- antiporter ClcA
MEKREIDQLEPYIEKRTGFTWLPQSDTEYYASELADTNLKISQYKRDVMNIPDYLLWSIGNFFLFFVFGIICIILSIRVRELKRNNDYDTTLKISQRTLVINIFTTIIGVCFLVTMLGLLINKSSTNF